jgi:hypothetical protein
MANFIGRPKGPAFDRLRLRQPSEKLPQMAFAASEVEHSSDEAAAHRRNANTKALLTAHRLSSTDT